MANFYTDAKKSDQQIDLVKTTRNRCISQLNALENDSNQDLIFNEDTGTIVTQGKEYGKGVFIPKTNPGTFAVDFGNIEKGTDIKQFANMSLSDLLQIAFGKKESLVQDVKFLSGPFGANDGKKYHSFYILQSALGHINIQNSGGGKCYIERPDGSTSEQNLPYTLTWNDVHIFKDGQLVTQLEGGIESVYNKGNDVVKGSDTSYTVVSHSTATTHGVTGFANISYTNSSNQSVTERGLILNNEWEIKLQLKYKIKYSIGYEAETDFVTEDKVFNRGTYTQFRGIANFPAATPAFAKFRNENADIVINPASGNNNLVLQFTAARNASGTVGSAQFSQSGQQVSMVATLNKAQEFAVNLSTTAENVNVANIIKNLDSETQPTQLTIENFPLLKEDEYVTATLKQKTNGNGQVTQSINADLYDSSGFFKEAASSNNVALSTATSSTVRLKGGYPITVKFGDEYSYASCVYKGAEEINFTIDLSDANQNFADYLVPFQDNGIKLEVVGSGSNYDAVLDPTSLTVKVLQNDSGAIKEYKEGTRQLQTIPAVYDPSTKKLKYEGIKIAYIKITGTYNISNINQ